MPFAVSLCAHTLVVSMRSANAQKLIVDYDFSKNLNDSTVHLVPMAAKGVYNVTTANDPSGVGASKLHLVVPPGGYMDDLIAVKTVYKVRAHLLRALSARFPHCSRAGVCLLC